jgi:branched-chain amino acid transport system ATP-binding protein
MSPLVPGLTHTNSQPTYDRPRSPAVLVGMIEMAAQADSATSPPRDDHGTPSEAVVLSVDALSRHFGGLRAVNDVTFSIASGSITSIIGPNGAGKSTLFNVITGVLRPSAGRVFLNAADVTGWSPHRLSAAGVGRTFQNTQLFPNLNVLENVLVGAVSRTNATFIESVVGAPRHRRERRASIERARQLLRGLDVDHRVQYFPRELPYGDQRRVEVARALATDPHLLMLDEPLAGMTHREAAEFVEVIQQLNADGKTIVVIEHNMRQVMAMSRAVIVLSFGIKIAEGPPSEITKNPKVLEAYLG